jgi:hypothetical protein
MSLFLGIQAVKSPSDFNLDIFYLRASRVSWHDTPQTVGKLGPFRGIRRSQRDV